jgi:uncharacterized protein (DUF2147 family)
MTQIFSRGLLILGICLLLGAEVQAQTSPVGQWRTIDDRTGEPRSVVEIVREADGSFSGYIRELYDASRRQAVCEVCPDDWGKNQPLIGLQILRDLHPRGNDYRGGQILDPEEGKVYGVRLQTTDNGQRLEVRGFLRVPLMGSALGRTQTWERVN